jgi:hypothetical protein
MGNFLPYGKKSATYIPARERINYSIRKKILFIPKEERGKLWKLWEKLYPI